MADELNTPTHRYYQPRYNILLAPNEVSKQLILASGVAKIDAKIINPLFALAEPGVWYDPSDLTTLYQDNVGTTPVTAPAQTVGLMLDKSQNGVGTNGSACRNLLTYTEEFDNAYWTSQEVGLAANSTVAPDGTLTADKIIPTAVSATHAIFRVGVVSSQTCAVSFYMKSGGYDTVHVRDGATASNGAVFNSATGVVTNTGTGVGSMSSVGNGWYRCVVIVATTGVRFYVPTAASTFTGDGTSGVYLWGAQLELGSTATAYQPITSSWSATIAGNHATQATLAQRPTYGINPITGTRNLLLTTDSPTASTGASVTTNVSTAPDGTNNAARVTKTDATTPRYVLQLWVINTVALANTVYTVSRYVKYDGYNTTVSVEYNQTLNFDIAWLATFNVTASGVTANTPALCTSSVQNVGNGWYRIAATFTSGAAPTASEVVVLSQITGASGTSVLMYGAQLELGSTATAYQKVVTQYEVTEAGVQSVSYLAFVQGIDDGMVTNTITPAIDKVQVFAGVRKLSDAAIGVIAELGTGSGNGLFFLAGPRAATGDYGFFSKGTVGVDAQTPNLFSAPITNILTGLGDISGDISRIRVNGGNQVTTTTDQGTGNYLAYPLYLGRRGGTTLPYNGRLYSLIVRFGANLTDGQITSTESWVNSKTGAY